MPNPVVRGQEAKVMNFYVPVPCVSAQSRFFARCAASERELQWAICPPGLERMGKQMS